jgi:hypothetical protein
MHIFLNSASDKNFSAHRQEIGLHSQGFNLAFTLHLPASDPPYPAVLMLWGPGQPTATAGSYSPHIWDAFPQSPSGSSGADPANGEERRHGGIVSAFVRTTKPLTDAALLEARSNAR